MSFEAPREVAAYFAPHSLSWFVAGGWAVDLFLGRQTRAHQDVEVAVFRRDQRLLREVFEGWSWSKVVPGPGGGLRTGWSEQEWLELPIHELYAQGPKGEVEILLQESDEQAWKFRRELSVSIALAEVGLRSDLGIPILKPEIVLLYKAKSPRPKDEEDLAALLPALDEAQVRWLGRALDRCHPGHPWRSLLNAKR